MKNYLPFFLLVLSAFSLSGQDLSQLTEGKISYVTAQNIYVKFSSTATITAGDTLYLTRDGHLVPGAIVKDLSSISCVCVSLVAEKFTVGTTLVSTKRMPVAATATPAVIPAGGSGNTGLPARQDSSAKSKTPTKKPKQLLSGYLSVVSYLNFSNNSANNQQMRYNFSMAIQNIGGSKFSAETYLCFAHSLNNGSDIKSDIFNGLKIYSLAVNYEINRHNNLWLGRKINPRISNVGAIDGLQYELKTGAMTFGAIAGTRPDYRNYSFNASLLQYGGYVSHDLPGKNGTMQTTLAFVEQTNNGVTDRRFAYVQYSNALVRNLYFFGSADFDFYKKTMNPVDTTVRKDTTYKINNSPSLSNVFVSLRYRPLKQLSFSVTYSSRQNVIYYETYKTIVDKLLEAATVQGFTVQVTVQPVKLLSIGINAGYRDSKKDPRPTKNYYGYLTYSRLPGLNVSATVSVTVLETGYMSGKIYSGGLSRDFAAGKLSAGLDYRYVIYKFYDGETMPGQHMGEINFTWRIIKKLSFGLYYEGTFDKQTTFNRIYVNITQRF